MKCEIIRDLLPNYIDHLTSDESNEEIENHFRSCDSCREFYEKMSMEDFPDTELEHEKREIESREELKLLKDFRKKRRSIIFSALGIVIAAILAVCFLIFGWISVPYELAGPEAMVFENPIEIEYELDSEKMVEESECGIYFTVADSTVINWFPRAEIQEVIVDGEPRTISFVASCTKPWEYFLRKNNFLEKNGERERVTFTTDDQGQIQGHSISGLSAVYYLDRGISRVENGDNGTILKLMEKYGHMIWSKED